MPNPYLNKIDSGRIDAASAEYRFTTNEEKQKKEAAQVNQ